MPHPDTTISYGRFARRLVIAFVLSVFSVAPVLAAPVPSSEDGAPSAEVSHARDLATNGDAPAAIRELQPYVASHPRDLDAGRYLGDLFLVNSDPASAERAYLVAHVRELDAALAGGAS